MTIYLYPWWIKLLVALGFQVTPPRPGRVIGNTWFQIPDDARIGNCIGYSNNVEGIVDAPPAEAEILRLRGEAGAPEDKA